MPDTADAWIDHLNLERHPEGGYYRETYRTDESVPASALPDRFDGPRDAATLIYFLLPADSCSALHRSPTAVGPRCGTSTPVPPLTLHQSDAEGTYTTQTLGRAVTEGQQLHTVVPAGTWFGATVEADGGYGLAGCTTAPAFEFADFELADRATLAKTFPQHREVVERLTR